jgi:electron transport complex protein RnfE
MQSDTVISSDQEPAADVLALFALCPLLAVSDTLGNAFAASAAMFIVAVGSTLIAAVLPRWLDEEIGFAALALIVTTVVASISLWAHAWLPGTYESLGVFLPLIVSNVLLMVQAQARDTTPARALMIAARTALFVIGTMLTLGFARELVGRGSWMRDSDRMFGDWSSPLTQQMFREDMGFLLAVLPPGAFIALGLLFALANWWRRRA